MDAGFNVIDGRTGIVPVIVGSDELAFAMWKKLYDEGVEHPKLVELQRLVENEAKEREDLKL